VMPRYAASTEGWCTVRSAITRFEDIVVADVAAEISTLQVRRHLHLSTSRIEAVRGRWDDAANAMLGEVTLNGESYTLANGGVGVLETRYSESGFEDAWRCAEGLAEPVSFACDVSD